MKDHDVLSSFTIRPHEPKMLTIQCTNLMIWNIWDYKQLNNVTKVTKTCSYWPLAFTSHFRKKYSASLFKTCHTHYDTCNVACRVNQLCFEVYVSSTVTVALHLQWKTWTATQPFSYSYKDMLTIFSQIADIWLQAPFKWKNHFLFHISLSCNNNNNEKQ